MIIYGRTKQCRYSLDNDYEAAEPRPAARENRNGRQFTGIDLRKMRSQSN